MSSRDAGVGGLSEADVKIAVARLQARLSLSLLFETEVLLCISSKISFEDPLNLQKYEPKRNNKSTQNRKLFAKKGEMKVS